MTQGGSQGPRASQRPTVRVVAALVEQGGRYLITQRRPGAILPLLWEFPGGRVEIGETDAHALRREVVHRLGVQLKVGKLVGFVCHRYERYSVDLHLYQGQLEGGTPQALNVAAFRWVQSKDFELFSFTPADERSVSALLGLDAEANKRSERQ